jgi:hypothetical protein
MPRRDRKCFGVTLSVGFFVSLLVSFLVSFSVGRLWPDWAISGCVAGVLLGVAAAAAHDYFLG